MTDFTIFLAKLAVFKALILKDSISPEYLGSLLEEMLGYIRQNAQDIAGHLQSCSGMQGDIKSLQDSLAEEIALRDTQYEDMIAKLELILGDHATEAIDNFKEILHFLEGIKDTESLIAKLTALAAADTALGTRIDTEAQTREDADTALGTRIDTEAQTREQADVELMDRTSDTVVCLGFLGLNEQPSAPGIYIRKDGEGDPIIIVTSDGSDITTEYPEQGKVYICQGKGYIYNGIMLVPVGYHRMIFDGGTPATRTNFHLQLNGGTPATRASILKQIDCGTPRTR